MDYMTELSESPIARKKREIVQQSMAVMQQALNTWLNQIPEPANKSRGKRSRDDQDSCGGDQGTGSRPTTKTAKKRVKSNSDGRKFACPYCKHDPDKYMKIKTCLGPGWAEVHRVKEHVYRKHALPKHMCIRCFDPFENEAKLKEHQRAETPCRLNETDAPDGVGEEKEKRLRAKSSPVTSDSERWEDMYRILFPGEKVPSPYQDDPRGNVAEFDENKGYGHYHDIIEYLREEVPRQVKPLIESEVDRQFKTVQNVVNIKAMEICKQVHTKLLRTLAFQQEQTALQPEGSEQDGVEKDKDKDAGADPDPDVDADPDANANATPGTPRQPSPALDTDLLLSFSCEDLSFFNGVPFDIEQFMDPTEPTDLAEGSNTTGVSADSAYYTSSEGYVVGDSGNVAGLG